MGFSSLTNGLLLAAAVDHGFDALLTKDTKLQYEQNLDRLPLSVVVLRAKFHDIELLRPIIPALLEALKSLSPHAVTHVPSA